MRKNFISPLRRLLIELESTAEDPSTMVALRSTTISLERVEEILAGIKL
jgi:hypothetical protein